jgi:hypothetical protein
MLREKLLSSAAIREGGFLDRDDSVLSQNAV